MCRKRFQPAAFLLLSAMRHTRDFIRDYRTELYLQEIEDMARVLACYA